jgi:hypothetical protein
MQHIDLPTQCKSFKSVKLHCRILTFYTFSNFMEPHARDSEMYLLYTVQEFQRTYTFTRSYNIYTV